MEENNNIVEENEEIIEETTESIYNNEDTSEDIEKEIVEEENDDINDEYKIVKEKNKGIYYYFTRYGHKPHTSFDYSNKNKITLMMKVKNQQRKKFKVKEMTKK